MFITGFLESAEGPFQNIALDKVVEFLNCQDDDDLVVTSSDDNITIDVNNGEVTFSAKKDWSQIAIGMMRPCIPSR